MAGEREGLRGQRLKDRDQKDRRERESKGACRTGFEDAGGQRRQRRQGPDPVQVLAADQADHDERPLQAGTLEIGLQLRAGDVAVGDQVGHRDEDDRQRHPD